MPNHVHALVRLPEPSNLTRFIHGWKRMSSFRIRQWYAEKAPNYFDDFGPGDKFWQPKSYVFHVYSKHKLEQKLDYMHLNPVRAGLVAQAEDWKWSSARWYLLRRSSASRLSGSLETERVLEHRPGIGCLSQAQVGKQPGPPSDDQAFEDAMRKALRFTW